MTACIRGDAKAAKGDLRHFGQRLRVAMAYAAINGAALSRMIGEPRSRVSEFVTGARVPQLDTAVKIARAVCVPLDWLVEDSPAELRFDLPPAASESPVESPTSESAIEREA